MHSNGSMMYIMCMCAIALLLAPVSRTKCCQMTDMRVVPAFKELHLSYMQLSEASSHAPDSTKGPTLESCLFVTQKCLPDMQQQPQDVLKTLQHAHTKSSVDQMGMQLHD